MEGAAGDLVGGYSFEHVSQGNETSVSRHGWNASAAMGLAGSFAFVADASGHYGSSEGVDRNQLTLMGGPRFSFLRGDKSSPFVHALFGLVRETAGIKVLDIAISENENRFGMLFGGGLDVRLSGPWALRLEGDYERSSKNGNSQSGFRGCVDAVYRFRRRTTSTAPSP
jgi:opacity protein-like surface antigen